MQFRAVDGAGNRSNWYPATGTVPGGTVRIDRTAARRAHRDRRVADLAERRPTTVVSAGGATDAGGSGLAGYQYRTLTNGGSTWGATVTARAATITAEGETIVQFRAQDGAGNVSAWAPASADRRQHRPARPHAAHHPHRQPAARRPGRASPSVNVTAAGGSDTRQRRRLLRVPHLDRQRRDMVERRPRAPAVTISAEGVTLVQFRAVDGMGFVSALGADDGPAPPAPSSSTTPRPAGPP